MRILVLSLAAATLAASGCVIGYGSSIDYLHEKPPGPQFGVAFGNLKIKDSMACCFYAVSDDAAYIGHWGAPQATMDNAGNFFFVLEPGGYFLRMYKDGSGRTHHLYLGDAAEARQFHFKVKPGTYAYVGSWLDDGFEDGFFKPPTFAIARQETPTELEILEGFLASSAVNTPWEKELRAEIQRRNSPAVAPPPPPPPPIAKPKKH
jgi:hypothetical protein